jgi:signal transduction histidine kinase
MNTTKTTRQRTKTKPEEIDFKKIIAQVTTSLNKQEGAHLLTINTTIEGLFPFVADKELMELVVTNMISNAIRFRHPHEMKPTLNIHVELSPDAAMLSFKDNGIGIDAEYLPRIFDMFFCVPGQKTEGSGLGLFAAREAIKKMKGTINVKSIKGTSTTFTASIPNRMDPDMKRKITKLLENSK